MDKCHLKNAELEAKHQKYKGRVVLRGDIVKDDSGSYAVFTEQGSSASQMTAAKIMDIISRLPGCDGQAADAVSAYTQVKMEDARKLFKIPKSECPDVRGETDRTASDIDHPTSSSRSSTLPTMTSSIVSSDSVSRQARRDLCGIDSFPVTVSSKHVERQPRGDLCSSGTPGEELLTKPTKNPKPNKNQEHDLERRDLFVKFRHTGMAPRIQRKSCGWQSSWTQTHTPVLLMKYL